MNRRITFGRQEREVARGLPRRLSVHFDHHLPRQQVPETT